MVTRARSAPSLLATGVSASRTANPTPMLPPLPSEGNTAAAAIADPAAGQRLGFSHRVAPAPAPTLAPASRRGGHPQGDEGVYAAQDGRKGKDPQTAPAAPTPANGTVIEDGAAPTRRPLPRRTPVRRPMPWPGVERTTPVDPEEERRFIALRRRVHFTLSPPPSPPPSPPETPQKGSPTRPSSPASGAAPAGNEDPSPSAPLSAPAPAPAGPEAPPPAPVELRPLRLSSLSFGSDKLFPDYARFKS
ncbi:hypothetical protein C8A03DRAFT_32808 [Achaetomium macrosporum]|uniref:Uncharacterized protein n=1 Tax=Achaetomium macrosporum TaxID=79813 RepID=A0AAN7CBT9_9PEZI|nr:hypothetical protein C8A03DRAFT_32808 [Achaetomium macrosporum]